MLWSTVKLALLNTLLKWVAGKLWPAVQDAVGLFAHRDDLTGDQKRALAREILLDAASELGTALSTAMANFLIECAVQYLREK